MCPQTAIAPLSDRAEPLSVLVVDDDLSNQLLVKAVLVKVGYSVTVAESGKLALQLLQELRPSVIIMDYMMPLLDGPETICRLREIPEHFDTPVILLTASDSPKHIGKAFAAGAQDYLTRPVNLTILLARVAAAIELKNVRSRAELERCRRKNLQLELEEARQVQQSQLPSFPLQWYGWRAAGAVVPSGKIGGDLLSGIVEDGTRTVLALVDVSGHGVAAALIASQITAELRSALVGRSLTVALAFLNEKILSLAGNNYAVIAVIETALDEVRVVNAGLPPILLLREGRVILQVAGNGMPPGLFPNQLYEERRISVELGDRLVLMSDGLTEPFGDADDTEGQARAMQLMGERWSRFFLEGEGAVREVEARFDDERPDDATILLLERIPALRTCHRRFEAAPSTIVKMVRWIKGQLPGWGRREMTELGLTEAVTNAVIHGVMGKDSEKRADFMPQYAAEPDSPGGELSIAVMENENEVIIGLSWEGAACPRHCRQAPQDPDPLAESGRGLQIIHSVFDDVSWKESGLEVELIIRRTTKR